MIDVTRGDVDKRTDGNGQSAGGSYSLGSRAVEVFEHQHVRAPLQVEFIEQADERAIICVRILDVPILLKPLDRRFVASRDSQDAIGEDSLAVDYVTEDLLNHPFSLRVGERAFFFRHLREYCSQFVRLRFQYGKDVIAIYESDISDVIWIEFVCIGSVHNAV